MENLVNVYFFGKRYQVPGDLTIMTAMEYAGYTLTRGCGCRHGFCGACATIYRIKGNNELKTCLACQTQVQEGMYIASIPFFPTDKRAYEIEDLKPNQQVMMELYPEIYSCIGSVKTTDGTEPALTAVDFAEKENVLTFTISFNDPVSLTGNGTAKATFYGENYHDATGALIIYKEVDIPADSISTSGKNLVVAVPASEYIPGAYVAVTYSAGIVKNGADAVNAAYENRIIGYDEEGEIQKKGIFGYYDYVNWDFSLVDPATLPDEPEGGDEMEGEGDEEEEVKVPVYFQDWTQLVMKTYGSTKYGIVTDTDDTNIRVTVTLDDGKTISYDAAPTKYAAIGENVIGLMLNEDPTFGGSISYTIAEASFADLFGNVNNKFTAEDEYYCSYGYKVADLLGDYTISGINLWQGVPVTYPMTIAASDNSENGNVMITNYFGVEGKLYCNFNVHSGKLVIPEGRIFAEGYASYFNGAGNQTFDFTPGKLSNSTAFVMLVTVSGNSISGYAKDANGVNIGVANFVATLNK